MRRPRRTDSPKIIALIIGSKRTSLAKALSLWVSRRPPYESNQVMKPIRPAPLLTTPPVPLDGPVRCPLPQSTSTPRANPASPAQPVAPFSVDIYADDVRIYLRAELPGVTPATIQIQPHAGHLTVFASATALAAGDPTSELLFGRQIPLPGCSKSTTLISADYALGILTLVLSCAKDPELRPIAIPVN